jgi:hypothetical protein
MILPPPETSSASGSPEAVVAILTLIIIGVVVYGLGKIKFSDLKWLYRLVSKTNNPKND